MKNMGLGPEMERKGENRKERDGAYLRCRDKIQIPKKDRADRRYVDVITAAVTQANPLNSKSRSGFAYIGRYGCGVGGGRTSRGCSREPPCKPRFCHFDRHPLINVTRKEKLKTRVKMSSESTEGWRREGNGIVANGKASPSDGRPAEVSRKRREPVRIEGVDEFQGRIAALIADFYEDGVLPSDIDTWSYQEQFDWVARNKTKDSIRMVRGMRNPIMATTLPGDCGRSPSEKPAWLDMEKFRRGQRFAMDNLFGIIFAQLLSLFMIYSFTDDLKPLIFTKQSGTPYLAFNRFLSTVSRIRDWYTSDPWEKDSGAYREVRNVRAMHRAVRRRLCASSREEINALTRIPGAWCPLLDTLREDFRSACPEPEMIRSYDVAKNIPLKPRGLNQADMSATLFGFVSFSILYPRAFGIHDATPEDLEGFCHLWRVIGYLLGIEDEYNFCHGDLETVQSRAREFVEHEVKPNFRTVTPEWEHMTRCVLEGVSYCRCYVSYEAALMYCTEILDVRMKQLYASMTYASWVIYLMQKYFFQYAMRFKIVVKQVNKFVNGQIDVLRDLSKEKHLLLQQKSAATMSRR
ncbi:hypothetical protein KM043_004855 [Ampulex compressa]|nr:hypothetical protein KM043_004855 [Ampulex compressa]